MRIHISINTTMAMSSTPLITEIPMDTRELVVGNTVSVGVEAEQVIIRLYKNNVLNEN